MQKPLRPELIPYNYHPALLPPQMANRPLMVTTSAPTAAADTSVYTPLMISQQQRLVDQDSSDMMAIYSQQQAQNEKEMRGRGKRGCMEAFFRKYKERSKRIDIVSRLVFPFGFFIFNCVYWAVYLVWNQIMLTHISLSFSQSVSGFHSSLMIKCSTSDSFLKSNSIFDGKKAAVKMLRTLLNYRISSTSCNRAPWATKYMVSKNIHLLYKSFLSILLHNVTFYCWVFIQMALNTW